MAKQKMTVVQRQTVTNLLVSDAEKLIYYKGGYWATPDRKLKSGNVNGAPEGWYVTHQTIDSMERQGWLLAMPNSGYKGYDGLQDRILTDAGLEALRRFHSEQCRCNVCDAATAGLHRRANGREKKNWFLLADGCKCEPCCSERVRLRKKIITGKGF